MGVQAVLSLFSSGRMTGMAFDCINEISQFVPVYDGYSIRHETMLLHLGGRDLDRWLYKLIYQQIDCLTSSIHCILIPPIKKRLCYVALNFDEEASIAASSNVAGIPRQVYWKKNFNRNSMVYGPESLAHFSK
jgi:actin